MNIRYMIGNIRRKVFHKMHSVEVTGMPKAAIFSKSPGDNEKILLSFVSGFVITICICVSASIYMEKMTAELKIEEASGISLLKPDNKDLSEETNLEAFRSADPFKTKSSMSATKEPVAVSLNLEGTLSPYAAYLNGGSGPELIMKGQEYMGYILVSVAGGEASVKKDGVLTTLYMPFTSAGGKTPPSAPKVKKPSVWNREPGKSVTGVEAAGPGVTGALPRELVDKLLMDPYEELAKIRMIPGEGGMKIARIASDSILASVGVIKNDVIKAVNGVTIANLGDATNAINSMMSGTRFDVTVERGGAPVELKYEVR